MKFDKLITSLLFLTTIAACAQSKPVPAFYVAAIVDTATDSISREEVQEILTFASANLKDLTGFEMQLTDFVEDGEGGSVEIIVQRYVNANTANLPNGIILFSAGDDDRARINRGYAQLISAPTDFSNSFVAPGGEDPLIYIAVVDFNYLYAACGYGDTRAIQSAFPIGDECGGDVMACIEWHGNQVCERALPFLTTPIEMISGIIVHEFMHPFDWEAGPDVHYWSQACNEAMGWPADHYEDLEAEHYNGMCPYVYEIFISSYQP